MIRKNSYIRYVKTMDMEKSAQHEEISSIDLKAIREEKGLSLKEISYQSRISVAILEAIENKNFHLLPEPVYTRGFIKTYAQLLEINGEDILSDYNAYINELDMSQQQILMEKRTEKSRSRYRILGAVVAVLIVMVIIFIVSHDYKKETVTKEPPPAATKEMKEVPLVKPPPEEGIPEKHEEAKPPEASVETAEQAVSRDESNDKAITGEPRADASTEMEQQDVTVAIQSEQSATEKVMQYTLEIEATELTWLNIIEDFKPNEELLLKPGEKITRKASEKFIVYIGNAGGVNVSFQRKPLGPLGEHGKVIRLILPQKQEGNER